MANFATLVTSALLRELLDGRQQPSDLTLQRSESDMDAVLPGLGALTLFVEDLEASTSFYQGVLGLRRVHEDEDSTVFDLGGTLVNLLRITAAGELIDPAPVSPPGLGARMQLSAWVDDVDAVCAVLKSRGVALLNGPVDRPWGMRTAAFTDPSGTVWEIAQDIPSVSSTAG